MDTKFSFNLQSICISSFCTFLGFLPQLELQVEAPLPVNSIKWDSEISFEEAYKAIEEKFYGFKKVIPYKKSPRLSLVYIPFLWLILGVNLVKLMDDVK